MDHVPLGHDLDEFLATMGVHIQFPGDILHLADKFFRGIESINPRQHWVRRNKFAIRCSLENSLLDMVENTSVFFLGHFRAEFLNEEFGVFLFQLIDLVAVFQMETRLCSQAFE